MSKPEDIPQDVWDHAEAALREANIKAHVLGEPTDPLECISRAILSAEKRGEEREREACADLAQRMGDGRQAQSDRATSAKQPKVARDFESMAMSAIEVADAIRARSGNVNATHKFKSEE